MSEVHDRLIATLEQGRSDIPFRTEDMRMWAEGWNQSLENTIRCIRLDAALEPAFRPTMMERAASLADAADAAYEGWTSAEVSFERG